MREDYKLLTPENVELHYDIAGLGSRLLAAFADYTILSFSYLALSFGAAFIIGIVEAAFPHALADLTAEPAIQVTLAIGTIAIIVLATFFGWWGYFIAFELLWSGQSPGKRMLGLRVTRADGRPLGTGASLIRNVLRAIDIFLLVGVLTMMIDRMGRRLGDFAAGTIVVHEPRSISKSTFNAIAIPTVSAELVEALPNAGRITMDHYTLLRDFFGRRSRLGHESAKTLATQLATDFAVLLEVERTQMGDPEVFLAAVAHAFEQRHAYHGSTAG